MSLLSEGKTETEALKVLKEEKIDIYSIEEARKWAKIWGADKIRKYFSTKNAFTPISWYPKKLGSDLCSVTKKYFLRF